MDITAIVAMLSPFLKPYINKGLEEFSGEAGKSLWELIKAPFVSAKEKETVARLEAQPSRPEIQQEFFSILQLKMDQNPEYLHSIRNITNYIETGAFTVNQYGEKSVAIKENNGNINIS